MPYADKEAGLARRREYQRTAEGAAAHAKATKAWRERNKLKLAAHNAVSKALMRGKMERLPCFICAVVENDMYWAIDWDGKIRITPVEATANQEQ